MWAADDPLVGDQVAVKLVPWLEPHAMLQYRKELATLLVLRIPGVVRIRDEGEHGAFVYVVTERIHGVPFSRLAEDDRDPRAWLPSVLALLDTLARVHLAGVTHADLKPSNILVDGSGRPTILDFGLARRRGPGPRHDGVIEGTPRYMAPEQRRGEPVTPRTDLYAVGGMLLEMIVGAPLTSPPDLTALADRALPSGLASQLRQMLELDPEARPASAVEVLNALDVDPMPDPSRWLGEGPWTARQLAALFDDVEESLLHIAEDGGALLFEEGAGDPVRTTHALRRWVRAGDARWTADGRIEITREELDRLGASGPDAPETQLAARLAEGADEAAVTAEALRHADALEADGRASRALGVLDSAALWVRGRPEEAEVLQRRVALRVGRWMPRAIDEAAGAVAVSAVDPNLRASLTRLLRGCRAALAGEAAEARDLLLNPPRDLARPVRHAGHVMVAFAAQRLPIAEHRAVIDSLLAETEVPEDFVATLESKYAYRTGDYEAAGRIAEHAAEGSRQPVIRAERFTSAAAAWLEVGQLVRATDLAARAERSARSVRSPAVEFQGRWLVRVARYRSGEMLEPSTAFVDASARVSPRFEGMAGYVETAIAWRAGELETGQMLAVRTLAVLRATQRRVLASLVEALLLALGGPGRHADIVAEDARGIGDDLEIQVIALAAMRGELSPRARERGRALLARLAGRDESRRLDVLSIAECREAIR